MGDDFSSHPTRHTAAKDHKCECCERTIPKGSTYVRLAGVYEGGFWSLKCHADCAEAWWVFPQVLGCGWDEFSMQYVIELDMMTADEAQDTLNRVRGFYPHVVCRLERSLERMLAMNDDEDAPMFS